MREIRKSGSEGGGRKSPYPYHLSAAALGGKWVPAGACPRDRLWRYPWAGMTNFCNFCLS
jgi:hypothetical protein